MSEQNRNAGDQAPQPLTPEQIKTREAAFIYSTRISQGMEAFLEGPDYYKNRTWYSKRKPNRGACELTGTMEERILTIHTPPDKYDDMSTELTFKTKMLPWVSDELQPHGTPTQSPDAAEAEEQPQRLVYAGSSDGSTLYAQHGPKGFRSPEVPLEPADLAIYDAILEEMFEYVPEVIDATRSRVAEIMQGSDG